MTAHKRNLVIISLAGLLIIALMVFVYPSTSRARPGNDSNPSNNTSLAITTGQTAAILGAQQLLVQSDQVHVVYVPMTIK